MGEYTSAKAKNYNVDSKKGQHLGHIPGGTQKNSLWVNDTTCRVKLSYHLRFDKGMNDPTLSEIPPIVKTFTTLEKSH
jgi:hypothetical protein